MTVEQLAENYRPDQTGIDVVRKSRALFLAGIISAGKDALQDQLLESPDYYQVITHTTRPPRVNCGILEKDGVDYHFVSEAEMAELLNQHKMIEVNHFGNYFYGTNVDEFNNANSQNLIALENIDVNGISSMYGIAPQNITAIFIVPPDYNIWINRIKNRYGSLDLFNKEWQARRDITIREIENALSASFYHFVINDNLVDMTNLINKIVHNDSKILEYSDSEARVCAKNLLDAIKQTS